MFKNKDGSYNKVQLLIVSLILLIGIFIIGIYISDNIDIPKIEIPSLSASNTVINIENRSDVLTQNITHSTPIVVGRDYQIVFDTSSDGIYENYSRPVIKINNMNLTPNMTAGYYSNTDAINFTTINTTAGYYNTTYTYFVANTAMNTTMNITPSPQQTIPNTTGNNITYMIENITQPFIPDVISKFNYPIFIIFFILFFIIIFGNNRSFTPMFFLLGIISMIFFNNWILSILLMIIGSVIIITSLYR